MQQRTTPAEHPSHWQTLAVTLPSGASLTFRLPARRADRATLVEWMAGEQFEAATGAREAQEDFAALLKGDKVKRTTEQLTEAVTRAQATLDASHGYVIGQCWADPVWALETDTDDADRSAWPDIGAAVVDEMTEAGWSVDYVHAIGNALFNRLRDGMPSQADLSEVSVFGGRPAASGT